MIDLFQNAVQHKNIIAQSVKLPNNLKHNRSHLSPCLFTFILPAAISAKTMHTISAYILTTYFLYIYIYWLMCGEKACFLCVRHIDRRGPWSLNFRHVLLSL